VVSLGVCSFQMMWFWWMSRTGVDQKLELWRRTLEAKCFRLNRSKTEYMKCDFNATTQEEGDVTQWSSGIQERHLSLLGIDALKEWGYR
jgi:hypothetical protein